MDEGSCVMGEKEKGKGPIARKRDDIRSSFRARGPHNKKVAGTKNLGNQLNHGVKTSLFAKKKKTTECDLKGKKNSE